MSDNWYPSEHTHTQIPSRGPWHCKITDPCTQRILTLPLQQNIPLFILTAQNRAKGTHTHIHTHTNSSASKQIQYGQYGVMSPVLFWVTGGEAAVQATDQWSVTLQLADLILEQCLHIQPRHKSFISLCLISSLCQWSSVTTHLQVMILWYVYRPGWVSHTMTITFVLTAVRILQNTVYQDCSTARIVLVSLCTWFL